MTENAILVYRRSLKKIWEVTKTILKSWFLFFFHFFSHLIQNRTVPFFFRTHLPPFLYLQDLLQLGRGEVSGRIRFRTERVSITRGGERVNFCMSVGEVFFCFSFQFCNLLFFFCFLQFFRLNGLAAQLGQNMARRLRVREHGHNVTGHLLAHKQTHGQVSHHHTGYKHGPAFFCKKKKHCALSCTKKNFFHFFWYKISFYGQF